MKLSGSGQFFAEFILSLERAILVNLTTRLRSRHP